MKYQYNIRKKAMKFIRKQERKQQERLLTAIYGLPLNGHIKKMAGYERLYRLRVGEFRVLFEMTSESAEITLIDVTDADSRGQIYK